MFENKGLKRQILIDIVQGFSEQYQKEEDKQKKKQSLYKMLLDLERTLNEFELKTDNRFVTYCRREHLRKEFTEKLNKKQIQLNNDYLIDAYYNLYDYIVNDTWIAIGSVPGNLSAKKIIKDDDKYKKKGFICKQEKEILLEMIQELKDVILNDGEKETNNNEDETTDFAKDETENIIIEINDSLKEVTENIVTCPYCNSKDVWEYLYGEPVHNYNKNKYVLGGCEIDFSKKYKCKKCDKDF